MFEHLLARFFADDGLEFADDPWEGVRADGGAEEVMGFDGVGDPVAEGFVDGAAEGGVAGGDGADFGAESFHADDIGGLAFGVFGAHVDDAGEADACAGGGGGDAVLAGACFGDDALGAHVLCDEGLSERVVDFVGAGVGEVFAFEPDVGAPCFGEARGVAEWSGAADPVALVLCEFGEKGLVVEGFACGGFEAFEGGDECFGNEAAAEGTEAAARVGIASGDEVGEGLLGVECCGGWGGGHGLAFVGLVCSMLSWALRAAWMKARMSLGSFMAG